jgi:hypothetical protein
VNRGRYRNQDTYVIAKVLHRGHVSTSGSAYSHILEMSRAYSNGQTDNRSIDYCVELDTNTKYERVQRSPSSQMCHAEMQLPDTQKSERDTRWRITPASCTERRACRTTPGLASRPEDCSTSRLSPSHKSSWCRASASASQDDRPCRHAIS